jgi:hypothetical protein
VPGARPGFKHNETFIFQIATHDQQETNHDWNAIVGMAAERACDDRFEEDRHRHDQDGTARVPSTDRHVFLAIDRLTRRLVRFGAACARVRGGCSATGILAQEATLHPQHVDKSRPGTA